MNHELAKELQDAGFLPKNYLGARFYSEFAHPRLGRHEGDSVIVQVAQDSPSLGTYIPTLSELIEACTKIGDGCIQLNINTSGCGAWHGSKYKREVYAKGSTPEETVARLWLALNTKEG